MVVDVKVNKKVPKMPVSAKLEVFNRRLTNTENVLREIGKWLSKVAQDAFRKSGRQEAWLPSKSAAREGRAPLVGSGKLRDSFKIGDPNNLYKLQQGKLTFGSRLPYAKAQLAHPPAGSKDPVPPQVFDLSVRDKADLDKVLGDWVHGEIVKAGRSTNKLER